MKAKNMARSSSYQRGIDFHGKESGMNFKNRNLKKLSKKLELKTEKGFKIS